MNLIVYGSGSGEICVISILKWKKDNSYHEHRGNVNDLKLLKNNSFIISGGNDQKIVIFDLVHFILV